ncbi:potassium channel family protein [Stenomitos frigidus]|uniref:Potassium channel protein n=1 Tax=Stenomitos frigidus ULC18 TaxID=2107698 RepID=A0A2T1DT07_9CYAN|nr:potassium channel protein [Stenomitos frigidus]PSB23524.1 potassium channel protein [Stenomitos frigidus ULC18]
MHGSLKRILTGAGFLSLTLVVAVAGYRLSGWSMLDSIYMVVITVFGVGFGEIGPMSPQLRIFTMFVIIAGCTSVGYIFGGFFQMITEGEINRALGARRMTKEIKTLKQHVIICGYGRIGQILARQMIDAKQPFVIIDNNLGRIETAEAMGYLVRLGNATDEGILESAGIENAKVLATVLPDDAANVFITLTARGLNPNLIIMARGEYPSTEKKLRQAGADHVVLPAEIGALRMSHIITHPAALNFLDATVDGSSLNELLSQIDVQVDELAVPSGSPLVGSSISAVQVRGKGTFIVVALRQASGDTIVNPSHEVLLEEGDTVIVMGHKGDIPKFAHHYDLKRQMRWGARG